MSKTKIAPRCLSGSTIEGDEVVNSKGESLGKIEDVMLDVNHGKIAYAVLSFGGFLGVGDKLFAVPWGSLQLDADNKRFVFDVDKKVLEKAEGFDKDNWPSFSDEKFLRRTHEHYKQSPYWL